MYCYYSCPGKFKYGVCDLESLPKQRLDLAVLSQVKQIFTNTELIERVLSRVEAKRTSKVQKKEGELKLLEKEISQRRSLVKKYLSTFESGALQALDTLNERLTEIEEEIRLLKERKVCLAEEIKRSKVEPLTAHDIRKVVMGIVRRGHSRGRSSSKKSLCEEHSEEDQSPLVLTYRAIL